MNDDIALARKFFAEEVCFIARIGDPRVVAAFAKVPREKFLGPGPWRVFGVGMRSRAGYWTTPDANPRHVYHDVLVALLEDAGVNNGQPSLYAGFFGELTVNEGETVVHVGAGTGYYSALLAELVGPSGKVVAIEIDPVLAEKARAALAPWPQVEVVAGNALESELPPADAILASAGLAFPPANWLRALKPGGRLLVPLATRERGGRALLVIRPHRDCDSYVANFSTGVAFIDCVGARDPALEAKLAAAYARKGGAEVKSLRMDAHAEDASCWLHGEGGCLSKREPG